MPKGKKVDLQTAVYVLSERIDVQRKQIDDLKLLFEALRTTLNEVFLESKESKIRLDIAEKQPEPVTFFGNAPLHVSEEAEDAKWQLDNGIIDRKLYEEILEEVGLEPNVEIHY